MTDQCNEEVLPSLPSWAGEDQIDPCLCVLPVGHVRPHRCAHMEDS